MRANVNAMVRMAIASEPVVDAKVVMLHAIDTVLTMNCACLGTTAAARAQLSFVLARMSRRYGLVRR